MTSYFFDTNFLFKRIFSKFYFDEYKLNDYFSNDSMFISNNVEYEFSNIFLEFSNQFNNFLIEPYYRIDKLGPHITCEDYQKLTKSVEIIKFNNNNLSSIIWNIITENKARVSNDEFKKGLNKFIYDFNSYFHIKYDFLMKELTIHKRLDNYYEIYNVLSPHIHTSDLKICLDAHDLAVKNNISDLAFVSEDKVFKKNSELILENTKIDQILHI